MTGNRHSGRGRKALRGNIAMALMITSSLILMGNMMILTAVNQRRVEDLSEGLGSALFLAQAGVQRAIWEINYNGSAFAPANWSNVTTGSCEGTKTDCQWNGFVIAIPGPNSTTITLGTADIVVTGLNTNTPTATATGKSQGTGAQTRVVVQLEKTSSPRLRYAAFGDTSINPHTFAIIDSYDSTLGLYNAVTANSNGDLGTNATSSASIRIQVATTTVKGSAFIGPGGDAALGVTVDTGATLAGVKGNLLAAVTMPSVSMPSSCTELGAVTLIAGATQVLAPGTYCADSIKMDGPTSRLYTTGEVKLYVRNWLAIQYGSQIESNGGPSAAPEKMQIYLKQGGTSLPSGTPNTYTFCAGRRACVMNSAMPNHAKVTATLYAPDVDIYIGSYTDWYGAVSGKSVIIGSGKIHYDEHLSQTDLSGMPTSNLVKVKSWIQQQPY